MTSPPGAGKDSPFFGTRPLGQMPGSTKRPSSAAPTLSGPGLPATGPGAKTPTYDYGRGPSASYPVNPLPAATSPYGQPVAGPGPNPAAAYAQTAAAPTMSGPSRTSMFQVPSSAWQPSLPVSPWSTQERGAGFGASMDTETVLRTDLKALRRSRLKGWMYFTLTLGLSGFLGFVAVKQRFAHKEDRDAVVTLKTQLADAEKLHRQTLANLGVSETAAAAAVAGAPGKPAAAAKAAPAVPAGPPTARSGKLAEDLKKQLAGIPGLTVEPRGDRVVVGLETSSLFTGNAIEVGLTGYRVLFKFGKVLRTVKDRTVAVTVPSMVSRRGKSWNVAAARAVSLGRFLVDDISMDPHRVSARAPAPLGRGARADRIEFSLEPAPETTKS